MMLINIDMTTISGTCYKISNISRGIVISCKCSLVFFICGKQEKLWLKVLIMKVS